VYVYIYTCNKEQILLLLLHRVYTYVCNVFEQVSSSRIHTYTHTHTHTHMDVYTYVCIYAREEGRREGGKLGRDRGGRRGRDEKIARGTLYVHNIYTHTQM
jgi:hypothetical protein